MKNKRSKALALLAAAERELASFREKPLFSTLSQACEKTWVAANLLVEMRTKKEIRSSAIMRKEAQRVGLGELFARTRLLHVFHYEGSVALGFADVANEVEELIPQVKEEIGRS